MMRSRPVLSTEQLLSLLGPGDVLTRSALRVALAPTHKLAEVLVAQALHEGHNVGAIGASFVDSQRQRSAFYDQVLAEVGHLARPMKGPKIVSAYPSHLTRGSVDLDLVCDGVHAFWEVATVVATFSDRPPEVALWQTDEGPELVAAFTCEGSASVFEPMYRVEVSTCSFAGDFDRVPSRRLSTDYFEHSPWSVQLALVAEEQYQRPTISRDVVDAYYLVGKVVAGDEDPVTVAATLGLTRLLSSLLEHPLVRSSAPAVEDWILELQAGKHEIHGHGSLTSKPLQGVLLDSGVTVDSMRAAALSSTQGLEAGLLVTPLGAFGMTGKSSIDQRWMSDMFGKIEVFVR